MKLTFFGDFSLYKHNLNLKKFKSLLNKIEGSLVISLETPFLFNKDLKGIKPKKALGQDEYSIKYLQHMNPYLVNISNNHMNDFGNKGVEYTKKLLTEKNIPVFGAGYIYEDHNIFVDQKNKIVFFSYTTRNSDESYSKLFNTKDFAGPKRYSEELFYQQKKEYSSHKKIVLLHWGEENIDLPHPTQRIMARDLIDLGADLIIGSHSHRIQGYETYNNKYIFYSLGNFYFPHHINKGKKNRVSIIPSFEIGKNIRLKNIYFTIFDKKSIKLIDKISSFEKLGKYFNKSQEKYKYIYFKNRLFNRFLNIALHRLKIRK